MVCFTTNFSLTKPMPRICFVMEHRHLCKKYVHANLHLRFITTLNYGKFLAFIYLRNLLTHTVNNLLQTLNNVKSIQFFVVKKKFNIIHIMCENFKTIPWVLCKLQLI